MYWRLNARQYHLWLIKVWFSTSIVVLLIYQLIKAKTDGGYSYLAQLTNAYLKNIMG
jgi:hypothetical protein